jgi:hypothetical protein
MVGYFNYYATSSLAHDTHTLGREAGKLILRSERDEGVKRIEVYKHWFKSVILAAQDSNALIVLPIDIMTPRYRDEPPT